MPQPKLTDENKRLIWFPIVFSLVVITFVGIVSFFQHTKNNHFYEPYSKDQKGYIGKAEALFAELLNIEKEVKMRRNMSVVELLNERYPAFEFALPDDAREGECMLSDIRLVGIHEKYLDLIETKKLKTFYYASTLRADLKNQRDRLYQKIFNLDIRRDTTERGGYTYTVRSIKMIPELYKITFASHPWTGTISGQSYGKIDESNSLFLVYGGAILPLCRQNKPRTTQDNYDIRLVDGTIKHGKDEVDQYDYYEKLYEESTKRISLNFTDNGKNEQIVLQVVKDDDRNNVEEKGSGKGGDNKGDSVLFNLSTAFDIRCNDTIFRATRYSSKNTTRVYHFKPEEKSVRVVISHAGTADKVTEFYIFRKNLLNLLSYSINTSKGRERVHIDDRYIDDFTKQVVHVFNSNDKIAVDSVNLSLDPALSKMLEREIEKYVNHELLKGGRTKRYENIEMSVCVVNSANGEVLAASSYSTQKVNPLLKLDRRNPNTQRRFIGSSFKPLMTLATVLMYSDLLNMKIEKAMWNTTKSDEKKTKYDMTVLGYPIREVPHGIEKDFQKIDMKTFLSHSNDAYPIILAMYAFTDPNRNGADLPTKSVKLNHKYPLSLMIERSDTNTWLNDNYKVHQSRFACMLDELYNISSVNENSKNSDDKQNSPELYVWRMYNKNIYDAHDSVYFPTISPEITNMNYDSWTSKENFRGKIVSWVLGQGDNSWSPLKLAEAWARMTTKRRVELSLIKCSHEEPIELLSKRIQYRDSLSDPLRWDTSQHVDTVWNKFLDTFIKAQSDESYNLLRPMYTAVRNVDENLVVLSKTGTPDEFALTVDDSEHGPLKMQFDLGLFSFSLMTKDQFEKVKQSSDTAYTNTNAGISVIVRIVHTYNKEEGTVITKKNKIESSHARNFFSEKSQEEVLKKTLFYTSKLFQ